MDAPRTSSTRGAILAMLVRSGVVARGLFVIVLIALFVFPVPPRLLDYLLVANIAVSLLFLLRSLNLQSTRVLLVFPTVLLLTTLCRLGLNVASTRLILLHGDQGLDAAGNVIEAFGRFVVQGDFLVGAIIFAVITVVNFVVIAKGSARVAEVAARFALDALPGKQLSIDADVRAGTISHEQASILRARLQQESQFYGAMDGAMRFVQGDAIAGLVITFINAIGGVGIGLSRDLSIDEAVGLYGVLTIGDGLVTILPALLISVCAGVVVTHVHRKSTHATIELEENEVQWFDTQSLILTALTLLLLGLVHGFPLVPFAVVGLGILGVLLFETQAELGASRRTYVWHRVLGLLRPADVNSHSRFGAIDGSRYRTLETNTHGRAVVASGRACDGTESVSLDAACEVLAHPESPFWSDFGSSQVWDSLRLSWQDGVRELQRNYSVSVPALVVRESPELTVNAISLVLRGEQIGSFLWREGDCAVVGDLDLARVLGAAGDLDTHPGSGQAMLWCKLGDEDKLLLRRSGLHVLDAAEKLQMFVMAALYRMLPELLSLDDVKQLTDRVRRKQPQLVDEAFQKGLTYPELTALLRQLINERIPIGNLKLAFDAITQFQIRGNNLSDRMEWLTELYVELRAVFRRVLVGTFQRSTQVLVLGGELSDEFESVEDDVFSSSSNPGIGSDVDEKLRLAIQRWIEPQLLRGHVPVVIACPREIRSFFGRYLSRFVPAADWLRVVSFDELRDLPNVETVGVFDIAEK